eukprot:ANDGO_01290.mRNA.1 RNA polymerase II transcriptional coactivator KELP
MSSSSHKAKRGAYRGGSRKRDREGDAGSEAMSTEQQPVLVSLSNNRHVRLSRFLGKLLIDIREYYDKDGQSLPGTRGISLTRPQWDTLKASIAIIDKAVAQMESENPTPGAPG